MLRISIWSTHESPDTFAWGSCTTLINSKSLSVQTEATISYLRTLLPGLDIDIYLRTPSIAS